MSFIPAEELSSAQRHFAEREHAIPGHRGRNHSVYFYREQPWVAYRWLVDQHGYVEEMDSFSNHASHPHRAALADVPARI